MIIAFSFVGSGFNCAQWWQNGFRQAILNRVGRIVDHFCLESDAKRFIQQLKLKFD
jgi:hypothetical protein